MYHHTFLQPVSQFLTHCRDHLSRPENISVPRRKPWETIPKAFEKSSKQRPLLTRHQQSILLCHRTWSGLSNTTCFFFFLIIIGFRFLKYLSTLQTIKMLPDFHLEPLHKMTLSFSASFVYTWHLAFITSEALKLHQNHFVTWQFFILSVVKLSIKILVRI